MQTIRMLKAQGLGVPKIVEKLSAEPIWAGQESHESTVLSGQAAKGADRPDEGQREALVRDRVVASGGPLRLTLDDVAHPAYMFNYRFELIWFNDQARSSLLGGFGRLPDESEDRHVLPMLLKAGGQWQNSQARDLARANLSLAKSRLSREAVLATTHRLPVALQQQIEALYDEAPAADADRVASTVMPIDLPDGQGLSSPYRLIATYFREGIFVVCAPVSEAGGSLAEFLSRRDMVIRHLLKKRLPVLTPLAALVTDLQASTRICSELPPEEYFELINDIRSATDPIFRRYFGTHGKHVGDGMVYYFFPQPDSHYIFNAVRCADEIKSEVRKISAQWQTRKGWFNDIIMNTGLHQGTEWLGTFQTATSIEFTVLGDTINQAARLSDFARHGAIWATKSLIGKLSAEEKSRLIYGVNRQNGEGRMQFVQSTFAQIDSLIDLSTNDKLADIATLAVTEIYKLS